MKRWQQIGLFVVLVPFYLVAFTVVHELGHTVPARLLGDPDATFYLVQIGPGGQSVCLGCAITDDTVLSPAGNLVVALGGLLFTQVAALLALVMLRHTAAHTWRSRLFAAVALGYAFLDVPVQVIQGLLYNLERHTYPTGVDLMDAMLLISGATGAPFLLLKTILALMAVGYLVVFWRIYNRIQSRARMGRLQLATG
jgi:hypothetical protein